MGSTNEENISDKLIAVKSAFRTVAGPLLSMVTGDAFVATLGTNLVFETLFGIHSEVKTQRVIQFVDKLEKGIKKIDPDFDLSKSDNIELWDLIEEAIRKSSRANNEAKIDRLKQIILGKIKYNEDYDFVSRYLDLASNLNDRQILILAKYVETEEEFVGIQDDFAKTKEEKENTEKTLNSFLIEIQGRENRAMVKSESDAVDRFKKGISKLDDKLFDLQNSYNQIRRKRNEQFKILKVDEFNFLLNDLRVLGLIYNPGAGTASDTGEYASFRCTPLAIGFMKHLNG